MSELIARARAALEGVTPGPWYCYYPDQCCGGYCVDNDHGLPLHSGGDLLPNDARFVAAARQLVPDLADRLAALEQAVTRIREMAENHHTGPMYPHLVLRALDGTEVP